jgi:hypothetical protein
VEFFTEIVDAVRGDAGLIVAMILVFIGGARRVWVWGYQLQAAEEDEEEMRKERDEWKRLALESAGLAGRALKLAGDSS